MGHAEYVQAQQSLELAKNGVGMTPSKNTEIGQRKATLTQFNNHVDFSSSKNFF